MVQFMAPTIVVNIACTSMKSFMRLNMKDESLEPG